MSTATLERVCPCCDDWYEECECGNIVECDSCGHLGEESDYHDDKCPKCYTSGFARMVRDKPYMVSDWAAWAEYAEHAKSVDFGCQFDCDGKCCGSRDGRFAQWSGNKKACCVGCASNRGYLDCIPAEALELVESLYDKKDGFWRPDGCTLPHEYRSNTCLSYTCNSDERKANADNTGLEAWGNHLGILTNTENVARFKQRLQAATPEQREREENYLKNAEKRLAMLLEKRAKLELVEQE